MSLWALCNYEFWGVYWLGFGLGFLLLFFVIRSITFEKDPRFTAMGCALSRVRINDIIPQTKSALCCLIHIPAREVWSLWATVSPASAFAKHCGWTPGPQPWRDTGQQCLHHGSREHGSCCLLFPHKSFKSSTLSQLLEFFSVGRTLPSGYFKTSYVQATETSMYHWFPSFWAHNPWHITDFYPSSWTWLAIFEMHQQAEAGQQLQTDVNKIKTPFLTVTLLSLGS